MTAQASHNLINQYKLTFDLDTQILKLYYIVTGRSYSSSNPEYKHKVQPKESKVSPNSANWKGYIPTYVLDSNGHVFLKDYGRATPEEYSGKYIEKLEGDFFLVMREEFFGETIAIPFIDGVIVDEEEKWYFQSKEPDCIVTCNDIVSVLLNANTHEQDELIKILKECLKISHKKAADAVEDFLTGIACKKDSSKARSYYDQGIFFAGLHLSEE